MPTAAGRCMNAAKFHRSRSAENAKKNAAASDREMGARRLAQDQQSKIELR